MNGIVHFHPFTGHGLYVCDMPLQFFAHFLEFIVYLTNTLEIGVLMLSESFNNVTKDPDDFCLSSLYYFSMFTLCLYM